MGGKVAELLVSFTRQLTIMRELPTSTTPTPRKNVSKSLIEPLRHWMSRNSSPIARNNPFPWGKVMSKWFAAFGVGMVDTECFETRFDRIKRYEGKNEASWPFPSKEVTVTKETRVPMNGLAQPDKDGWIENTQTEPGCPEHLKGKRVEVSRGMGNVKGNAEA